MNELMIFEDNEVEVFELNGTVLFNPKHVAICLDITDINSSLRNMNDKQLKKLTNSDMHSMHIRKLNNAGENFLTESGVYKLIFKSRKPKAEKFQDWVTDEVLPAIRKTGGYIIDKPEDTPEEILARAVLIAQDTIKRKDEKINQLQIKTVRQKRKLKRQKPKVDFYDKVLDSTSDFTVTQIAKQVEMTATHLNIVLEQAGIQYRQSGQWLLKKEYQDKGLTKTRTYLFEGTTETRTAYSTVWTEKGRKFIIELLEDI